MSSKEGTTVKSIIIWENFYCPLLINEIIPTYCIAGNFKLSRFRKQGLGAAKIRAAKFLMGEENMISYIQLYCKRSQRA
jgi:hypothetical protein